MFGTRHVAKQSLPSRPVVIVVVVIVNDNVDLGRKQVSLLIEQMIRHAVLPSDTWCVSNETSTSSTVPSTRTSIPHTKRILSFLGSHTQGGGTNLVYCFTGTDTATLLGLLSPWAEA